MNIIVTHFKNTVNGILNGFDRIVFKGYLRSFMNEAKVNQFCQSRGILNKDYKPWMIEQTKQIITDATHYAQNNCNHGILPISSAAIRKEQMVHDIQEKQGITSGLIGVFLLLVQSQILCSSRLSTPS